MVEKYGKLHQIDKTFYMEIMNIRIKYREQSNRQENLEDIRKCICFMLLQN